jgi:hypothetical protein
MKSASDPGPATADLVGGIVPPPPRGAHARQTRGDAAWRFFLGISGEILGTITGLTGISRGF